METVKEVFQIIAYVISLSVAVTSPFILGWKNGVDRRLEKLEDGFKVDLTAVRKDIADANKEMLSAIAQLKTDLSNTFVSSRECKALMRVEELKGN